MTYQLTPFGFIDKADCTPPCDCIELLNGHWVQRCSCGNQGDLASAQDWCTTQNVSVAVITLTPAEIQSNYTRVQWAEDLIRQLPESHEGRNSWLLNYGSVQAGT